MLSKCWFYGGKPRNDWRTIVAAVPRAAHAVSVATLLLPPTHHACRRCLMRTMTVSPNFAFLIIGARVGLMGKRKVYSEALLCTRCVCSPIKIKTKPKQQQKKKTTKHQQQNPQTNQETKSWVIIHWGQEMQVEMLHCSHIAIFKLMLLLKMYLLKESGRYNQLPGGFIFSCLKHVLAQKNSYFCGFRPPIHRQEFKTSQWRINGAIRLLSVHKNPETHPAIGIVLI